MFKNYFKIAWRNLRHNKAYALINISGLALGIGCGIIIFILVSYHLSFDHFHHHKERIYRIVTEWHDETVSYSGAVPQPIGKAFRENFSFAEKTAMAVDYRGTLISLPGEKDGKKFLEESGVVYAEPSFFDIFNFPLLQGNINTALTNPNSAVITAKLAKKYFGTENALGKIIRVNNKTDFSITGILKDIPPNTDRQQEIYVSYANLKDRDAGLASDSHWDGVYSGTQCFVRLKPGITAMQVNKALALLVNKFYSGRDLKVWRFRLQPLSDIHFNPDFGGYTNKKYLWALSIIGVFLLITACVNFINLATAQALNRSKEIGVRKVLGSRHTQIFWQFMTETLLITLFADILAVGLAFLALPFLNQLLDSHMQLQIFSDLSVIGFLVFITLLVIFLSGFYPGFVLARFNPVVALKSKISQKHIGGFSLRRLLVIVQFAISQLLIIGVIVIARQIHYSKTADLGFNKESIVMLPVPITDKAKMTTLQSRLMALPGVEKTSFCLQAPASESNNTTGVRYDNRAEDEHWNINVKGADNQYISTFGLKLIAGRNFYPADTTRAFLVNEAFVRKLNLQSPQEVIGKTLSINGRSRTAPIVGVVKDFYNYSFHSEIEPICITPELDNYGNCAVKVNMRNISALLPAFDRIWNDTYPDYLYDYQFLDERIAKFYAMDSIMLSLVEIFAGIAVLIGCLGLFGLVSFMAVRKTKEIGVRKVLGASVQHILWLFGGEFSRLLLIAFLIAAPVAWWIMHLYLEDFKYKIKIGPGIFLLAILITFIIAAMTVGYRSIRSALANPVKSLRSE